ncbi:MAG TPA: hypothetical protein VHG33_06100 [Woeseiaceae bacterium]|nr:hypothetical protein [Woeseiaceae bacterium]
MQKNRRSLSFVAGLAALMLSGEAPAFDFNENVDIEAGSESGGESTVNGSIDVGSDAIVNGALETVNGSIRIERNAQVGNVETVNGRIRLAAGVTAEEVASVNGSISLDEQATADSVSVVNGKIRLEPGAQVASGVGNVNGEVVITGAEIGGDLSTVNGDVTLTENARLRGNLVVEEPDGLNWNGDRREPRIVIGPGARVDGEIVLEHEVELFISETAEVGGVTGVMSMDDAVRFSGDRP